MGWMTWYVLFGQQQNLESIHLLVYIIAHTGMLLAACTTCSNNAVVIIAALM